MRLLTATIVMQLLAVTTGFQPALASRCSRRSRKVLRRAGAAFAAVTELRSQQDLEQALKNAGDSLVIVDYAVKLCRPCMELAPKFAHLSELYDECAFYNVIGDSSEETKQLMASQGVREVPSFHFFKGGERLGVVTGAKLSSMDLIDAIESVRWES